MLDSWQLVGSTCLDVEDISTGHLFAGYDYFSKYIYASSHTAIQDKDYSKISVITVTDINKKSKLVI